MRSSEFQGCPCWQGVVLTTATTQSGRDRKEVALEKDPRLTGTQPQLWATTGLRTFEKQTLPSSQINRLDFSLVLGRPELTPESLLQTLSVTAHCSRSRSPPPQQCAKRGASSGYYRQLAGGPRRARITRHDAARHTPKENQDRC